MKTKLLFEKQNSNNFYALLVFCLFVNFGWSQNLMLNGSCDDFTSTSSPNNVSDNADAYDMTPNNDVVDDSGATVTSPYQPIWDNDALEDWLEVFYLGIAGDLDEQPGSTSSGNGGTRGVKLYDDGTPAITGCSRRLYQKVMGLTIGKDYTFSVDSRSEAIGTPSQVYILNTEITDELGINANGGLDLAVDGFTTITTDYDDVGGVFINTEITFTATNTFAVIYIRSLSSINTDTEVFYDNFSLVEAPPLSVNDVLASNFNIYPNPAKDVIVIESADLKVSSIEVFSLLGQKVLAQNELIDNKIHVSSLTKGMYLLKINTESGNLTKKIIIE